MNFKYSFFRFTQQHIRFMSRSKSKNHYDSLGIPSGSTQNEVKSAYYKLSMLYHPDRSQSMESAQKFRDITEAYEVLGNAKTRKLYDKGMYFGGATTTADDTIDKFHKSREMRSRPPPPTGRTPIYDFDEWSKNHYGATFQRQMAYKRRVKMHKLRREEALNDMKMERLLFVFGVILVACMYFLREKSDYDQVTYTFSLKPPKPPFTRD